MDSMEHGMAKPLLFLVVALTVARASNAIHKVIDEDTREE